MYPVRGMGRSPGGHGSGFLQCARILSWRWHWRQGVVGVTRKDARLVRTMEGLPAAGVPAGAPTAGAHRRGCGALTTLGLITCFR